MTWRLGVRRRGCAPSVALARRMDSCLRRNDGALCALVRSTLSAAFAASSPLIGDLCITPCRKASAPQFTPNIKRNCGLNLSYAKVSIRRGGNGALARRRGAGFPPRRESRGKGRGRWRPPVGSRFRGNDGTLRAPSAVPSPRRVRGVLSPRRRPLHNHRIGAIGSSAPPKPAIRPPKSPECGLILPCPPPI